MMPEKPLFYVSFLCSFLSFSLFGADILQTLDGEKSGALAGWPDSEALPLKSGSLEKGDFLAWQRAPVLPALEGQIQAVLTNGFSLRGEVTQWSPDGFTLETHLFGSQDLSYDDVWAVLFLDQASSYPLQNRLLARLKQVEPNGNDVLFLKSDHVEGILDLVKEDQFFFDIEGDSKAFSKRDVYAIRFGNDLKEPQTGIFLTTRGGFYLPGVTLNWNKNISVKTPYGDISLAPEDLAELRYVNPKHLFLGDLTPKKVQEALPNTEVPGVYPWPYQVNLSVHHRQPLRFDSKTLKQGIGVHSDSRLTWALPQKSLELVGACGLGSEARGQGSVHFRIYGDGKKLFDSGLQTGAGDPKRFRVNVAGKQSLTLEVVTDPESDEKNFTLDRAVWSELILVIK